MEFCCIDNFQSNSRWHGDCAMRLPVNHTFVEASYTVGGYLGSFRENEFSGINIRRLCNDSRQQFSTNFPE